MGSISKWFTKDTQQLGSDEAKVPLKGPWAENYAYDYLQQQGLTPITRNYRSQVGEIDLIMQDQEELVFVEVRYRKNDHFGSALESVTYSKQQKIIKTAELYLQKHYRSYPPCRYDILSITGSRLEWLKNAFP